MNVRDRIAFVLGYVKAHEPAPAPAFLQATAARARWMIPDPSLADNQAKLYQRLSWVHSANKVVSRSAAGSQLSVLKRAGEGTSEIVNHPFELLLDRPNPLQSRFAFFEATVGNYGLTGNSYWWLNKAAPHAPPAEIFVLPSNRMKVVPGAQIGLVSHYEWNVGQGERWILPPDEVVHFKTWHPRNMFVGLSPIESIATEAAKDIKAADYDLNFFANDNAKPEGAIAFSGHVPQPIMDMMEDKFKQDHGGTKRKLAMLSSAKDTDIKWLQFGLSHRDMRFLEGRTFTKEQIYDVFAPGLSSVLSVNATEANSRAGKATLMEMSVWPALQAIAQQITNDVLPLYGDGLLGKFEDVRLSDRAMDMQEQQAYSVVHTVDEIRKEFYDAKPIGDERGELLPAQIGQGSVGVEEEPEEEPEDAEPIPPQLLPPDDVGEDDEDNEEDGGQVKAVIKEVQPTQGQLVRDELLQWERFAQKRVKGQAKAREFEVYHIGASLQGAIEGQLEAAKTAKDITEIFADAMRWGSYP